MGCNFTHNVEIYAVLCCETTFIANLRCFVVKQILSKIYALLRGKISWSKMCLWKKKMTNIRYVYIYTIQYIYTIHIYNARSEDALVLLVKLVKSTVQTVESVETVETVETAETAETVETVETVDTVETVESVMTALIELA